MMRLLPILLLLSLLTACAPSPDTALRFALSQGPVTLDPRFATDAASERINRLLYRRLVEFDDASRPQPSLARWERLSPTDYRVTLQPGPARTFHDGTPLTADDVKATYDFVLDPANGSPHRLALAHIERIERLDAERLRFHLSRPDPLFPALLVLGIVPRALATAGHPFNRQPMGSGPLALVDWPDEGRLRLRRVEDGQAIDFVTVKDPTVRVLKLLRGEVDLLQNDLPPELADYLDRDPRVRLLRGPGANFTYLGFNLEDGDTGRPLVRRAVAHAIDREAIVRHLLPGARLAGALLPPEHWAGHPDLHGVAYDPAEARRLLAQAGYGPGRPLRLEYKTSADPFRVRLATVIQDQLARVGVEVKVRSFDWGAFYGDIKAGRFQLYSLSWVGLRTPDIFRYVFHSASVPPAGANRGRFRSRAADRLIEAAEAAPDLEAQAPLYRRLQADLAEELPYVPLWYEPQVVALGGRVEGYRPVADGSYDALAAVRLRRP
ncbi:ABC transporter substrate-binding protein [Endothiovibrio diazotrophicus]